MQETGIRNGAYGADKFGFKGLDAVHWNLTEPALYEHAIANGEASLVEGGALCAETGHHTGRSPKDKHTVVDDLTRDSVWWDGNRKMSKENFDNLLADFQPDQIKLDKELIKDIPSRGPRQVIVRALIQVCKDLGIDLVAEGVESNEEFQWLASEGIWLFQGYLFSRPGFECLPSARYEGLPQVF